MCYNYMGDFVRAVYDISMAIDVEGKYKDGEKDTVMLAEYHSKLQSFILSTNI